MELPDPIRPSEVVFGPFRGSSWIVLQCKTCGAEVPQDEADLIAHLWTHEADPTLEVDELCTACSHPRSEHSGEALMGSWRMCQHGRATVGIHICCGFTGAPKEE